MVSKDLEDYKKVQSIKIFEGIGYFSILLAYFCLGGLVSYALALQGPEVVQVLILPILFFGSIASIIIWLFVFKKNEYTYNKNMALMHELEAQKVKDKLEAKAKKELEALND